MSNETAARAGRRDSLLLALAVLLGTFGVYAATAEREAVNVDAYAASAGAWRIATAGTPWFDGVDLQELAGTHGDAARGRWISPSANGHVAVQRMAGPILVGIPFYWMLADSTDPADFSLMPGAMAAAALTALVVLLMFLALRRLAPIPLALAGALVFAFATPTWSVSANGLWTHPVTQLGIAGAAFAASRNRWWLAGIFLGIGMLGRPHIALIAAIVGLGVAWSRKDWRVAAAVGLPTTGALGLLAAYNRAIHGRWSIGGAYGDSIYERAASGVGAMNYDQVTNYLGFLFSFDRGFLIWSPLVLVLLPAVFRARKSLPVWTLWLVLGGIVYTFFQLRLNYFAGGVGFHAYRHGLELVTCMVPAFTLAVPWAGRVARFLIPPIIALQVAAFTVGAALEAYFVDIERVWTDNSLWLAMRYNPLVIGGWMALALAVGLYISLRRARREPTVEPAPAELHIS